MAPESLFALLEATKIIHPTSIRELRVSNGTVVMELGGFPWWLPFEEAKSIGNSSAIIEFTSVSRARLTESCLTSDPFKEDLENFNITNLAQAAWNKGGSAEVFCSEPVENPISLLTSLDRFLIDNQCPFQHSEFFHCGEIITDFINLSKSSAFQMAKGPSAVCEFVSKELSTQDVKHTITRSPISYVKGYLIQWWDGFLICEDAKISWSVNES
ncbi:hypothetical protein [Denitrobaculum tricleocarpae]|uniref:Uncharacterized protein n=1 Tax=Denitrobaculum tricleocarpae TaxID=2591009 RepID=A0A545TX80_9PROT|nr:hypothetical protein [Denitrobaculum tricleocarpae]TQV81833.1 hypothetical protein FKG95_06230 [Denitrobaculum tricleocarpae]